jgi:hypothetical protein
MCFSLAMIILDNYLSYREKYREKYLLFEDKQEIVK